MAQNPSKQTQQRRARRRPAREAGRGQPRHQGGQGRPQFGFTALTVVGDGDGRVGIGYGKAREVPVAVRRRWSRRAASMVKVSLKNGTLHYAVTAARRGQRVHAAGVRRYRRHRRRRHARGARSVGVQQRARQELRLDATRTTWCARRSTALQAMQLAGGHRGQARQDGRRDHWVDSNDHGRQEDQGHAGEEPRAAASASTSRHRCAASACAASTRRSSSPTRRQSAA